MNSLKSDFLASSACWNLREGISLVGAMDLVVIIAINFSLKELSGLVYGPDILWHRF